MAEAKHQEHERGAQLADGTIAVARRPPPLFQSASEDVVRSSKNPPAVDEMAEAKRRERGPQLAGGTTVVARRPPPAALQADDSGSSKYATVDETTEVKRREKERGPQLMGVAVVLLLLLLLSLSLSPPEKLSNTLHMATE